jgi:hypothetical protein
MMEAASTSETSVNFYQTTRHKNPEDSHLHTRRRENLKYHKQKRRFRYMWPSSCIRTKLFVLLDTKVYTCFIFFFYRFILDAINVYVNEAETDARKLLNILFSVFSLFFCTNF